VIRWTKDPEDKDYTGAESFLSLCFPPSIAVQLVNRLRYAPRAEYAVKDILRQSNLPLLPPTDSQVSHVLHKIKEGTAISAVLLIRGDFRNGLPLIVADGYHRVCSAYHLGDDQMVRCHIADIE
jgi:hypothetical protein